jgi:hypothetical protein
MPSSFILNLTSKKMPSANLKKWVRCQKPVGFAGSHDWPARENDEQEAGSRK